MDRFDFSPLFRLTIGFVSPASSMRLPALTARPSPTPLQHREDRRRRLPADDGRGRVLTDADPLGARRRLCRRYPTIEPGGRRLSSFRVYLSRLATGYVPGLI